MADGKYVYGPFPNTHELGYSMVISASHIIHKAYMEMFSDAHMLPGPILKYVDEKMNCEDLAMCIMVTGFLSRTTWPQSCAIAVKPIHVPYNLEAQGRKSLVEMLLVLMLYYRGGIQGTIHEEGSFQR